MRSLFVAIAKVLHRLGLARQFYHVDAGAKVRVTGEVLERGTTSPVADAEVAIERPAEGRETSPVLTSVGRTASDGKIDRTALVLWSYETPSMTALPRPSLPINLLVTKAGFQDERVLFDLSVLPSAAQVRQLTFGSVALARR